MHLIGEVNVKSIEAAVVEIWRCFWYDYPGSKLKNSFFEKYKLIQERQNAANLEICAGIFPEITVFHWDNPNQINLP